MCAHAHAPTHGNTRCTIVYLAPRPSWRDGQRKDVSKEQDFGQIMKDNNYYERTWVPICFHPIYWLNIGLQIKTNNKPVIYVSRIRQKESQSIQYIYYIIGQNVMHTVEWTDLHWSLCHWTHTFKAITCCYKVQKLNTPQNRTCNLGGQKG